MRYFICEPFKGYISVLIEALFASIMSHSALEVTFTVPLLALCQRICTLIAYVVLGPCTQLTDEINVQGGNVT